MKRNYSIDVLRIIAASAVLLFHVLGSSVNNDPMVSASVHTIATAVNSALSWHVPVFFMITGFLWLSQSKSCTYRKMWRNIRRFLLVLFTVGFVYAAMEQFFNTRQFTIELLVHSLGAVLTNNLWDHMWYLYSAIGVYLVLPAIKPFFDHSSTHAIFIFTGILFAFTILLPVISAVWGYAFPVNLPIVSPMFYVCAGGLIEKLQIQEKRISYISAAVFFCSITANFLVRLRIPAFDGLSSLFNSISSISLFLAITVFYFEAKEIPRLFKVSDCTFGIYLLHPFFINLLIKAFNIYPARFYPPLGFLLAFVGIWIASFSVTYVLRKISPIKKYIL